MIQHNVLFKWKPSMTPAIEAAAFAAFRSMAKQIPGIVSVSVGHQNSPEGLGKGYQVGLSVVFTDAAARDAYLPHPAHVAAVEPIKPHIDDVCVIRSIRLLPTSLPCWPRHPPGGPPAALATTVLEGWLRRAAPRSGRRVAGPNAPPSTSA